MLNEHTFFDGPPSSIIEVSRDRLPCSFVVAGGDGLLLSFLIPSMDIFGSCLTGRFPFTVVDATVPATPDGFLDEEDEEVLGASIISTSSSSNLTLGAAEPVFDGTD
jgi:hypothetical protein